MAITDFPQTFMGTRFSLERTAAYAGFAVVMTTILGGITTGLASYGKPIAGGSAVPFITLALVQFALYTLYFVGQIAFAKKQGSTLLQGALITGIAWNDLATVFFFLNYFNVFPGSELSYAIMSATILILAGVNTILRGVALRKLKTVAEKPTATLGLLYILAGSGILFVPLLPAALIILLVAEFLMSRLLMRDSTTPPATSAN